MVLAKEENNGVRYGFCTTSTNYVQQNKCRPSSIEKENKSLKTPMEMNYKDIQMRIAKPLKKQKKPKNLHLQSFKKSMVSSSKFNSFLNKKQTPKRPFKNNHMKNAFNGLVEGTSKRFSA